MVKHLNKDTHGMKTPPLLGHHNNYDYVYIYIYLARIYLAQICMGGFRGGGGGSGVVSPHLMELI